MKYLPLDKLADHPKNVRAKTEYSKEGIHALAASIKALGLLQSLVVQQLDDGTYGVLAGRRRMLALIYLKNTTEIPDDFKAPCKIIPKDTDHVTALSLAENTMQEPMAPLDEFEAFAAMIEEGSTVAEIAETFGATVRAVKERLRFGLVHRDIRAAVRAGSITLDVMKAYAAHPCLETQKRVFDGFTREPQDHQAWRVRNVLADQDIRADDPLAVMVMDRYRERGGEMVEGLFEEDTVLKDRALAETIRDEMLMEQAEAIRTAQGFKWAETRPRLDYSELSAYGRIYKQPVEQDEDGEARLAAIAERLDEIAEKIEAEGDALDNEAYEALNDEYEGLEEEAETLQNAYLPDQAARAGVVVAHDGSGGFRIETGLVRPEDYAAWQAENQPADDADTGEAIGDEMGGETLVPAPSPRISAPSGGATVINSIGGVGAKEVDPLSAAVLSGALTQDLAIERGAIVQAALTEDPDLARDALTYRLACSLLVSGRYGVSGLSVTVQMPWQKHSRPEAQDADTERRIAAAHEALDLTFFDDALTDGEKFRTFRALEPAMKDRILAACIGGMVEPAMAEGRVDRAPFMEAVAAEAVPDIRAVWRPTAANYWSRVTRDHMLALLKAFGLTAEAEEHRTVKKATLAAYMESLFAQPFATLTEEQRIAVETWTPPGMGMQGDMVFEEVEDDLAANDAVGDEAPEAPAAYSNLEPDEKTVGQNIHGETLIEDGNGVRSVEVGGVHISEPVPIIPGAGIIAPNPSDRKTRFLTVEEADERREAA